jgi:hypothetical protein
MMQRQIHPDGSVEGKVTVEVDGATFHYNFGYPTNDKAGVLAYLDGELASCQREVDRATERLRGAQTIRQHVEDEWDAPAPGHRVSRWLRGGFQ